MGYLWTLSWFLYFYLLHPVAYLFYPLIIISHNYLSRFDLLIAFFAFSLYTIALFICLLALHFSPHYFRYLALFWVASLDNGITALLWPDFCMVLSCSVLFFSLNVVSYACFSLSLGNGKFFLLDGLPGLLSLLEKGSQLAASRRPFPRSSLLWWKGVIFISLFCSLFLFHPAFLDVFTYLLWVLTGFFSSPFFFLDSDFDSRRN